MPIAPLRIIKNSVEYAFKKHWREVPRSVRGVYVLYRYRRYNDSFNVVYVGMAGADKAGVRGRLKRHIKTKDREWTHFSVFQVWDNISENEVKELEGLFRHIYRWDARANKLNKQRGFKKLIQLESEWFDQWT